MEVKRGTEERWEDSKKGIRWQVDEQDNGKGGHEATWDFYICKF
jgi:hypothetical protein